ncbi:N-6 DNA methylase [Microbacterium lacticum]|uniref:N-6 DNA methylase n=1 Tax=Microbacterium lacticum TaxID=33885 RepID=UPI0011449252|nr:N-6 DNA methylase [Microbacterium lacticum]
MSEPVVIAADTAEARKARGAFFTPDAITRYITDWAIRTAEDSVLEPSAGDAAFLVQAVRRLRERGHEAPRVDGVEIHPHSARVAGERVAAAGGRPHLTVNDFFLVEPEARYSVVIGNPPYIRRRAGRSSCRARWRRTAARTAPRPDRPNRMPRARAPCRPGRSRASAPSGRPCRRGCRGLRPGRRSPLRGGGRRARRARRDRWRRRPARP